MTQTIGIGRSGMGAGVFDGCTSMSAVVFKNMSELEVQQMDNYENLGISTDKIYTWNAASEEWVKRQGYLTSFTIPDTYKTYDSVLSSLSNDGYAASADLTAYYTKDETSSSSQISGELLKYQLSGNYLSSNALDNYYTKSETSSSSEISDAIPTKTSDLDNDSEFATSSWVLEQNYISGVPDTYALKTEVNIDYVSNNKAIYLSAGSHVTSVDCTDFIKDGMLSTAELRGTTLVLTFNTDAGSEPISVEMSSFVDNYDGKISDLSDEISSLSDAVDERAMLSDIPTDLSAFTNSPLYMTSSDVSAKLEEIDKKVFIDDRISGIQGYSDLSIIKLSAFEYDQLVADDETLSNNLYIVEDEFEDAYGQQVKNMARGTDLSDAVTLEQLNEVSNAVPLSVSQLLNDAGYTTNTGTITGITMNGASKGTSGVVDLGTVLTAHQSLDNYYTKSETSSASEISGAIANAGKGYTVVVRKLDDQGMGSGWCFVGGNQIEAQAVSLPFGLRIQHVDTSLTETSVYNQSFIVVPNGVNSSGYDTVYVNGVAKNDEVIQLSGDTLVELYYLFCFLEGTLVKLADGTSKPIEDITYDDMLSVWNFDDGHLDAAKPLWINKPSFTTYCWETELSSGKRIRTAGIHGHRFFSLDENKFLYADEIDGHHIWTEDGEDVVTSSKLVQGINARFYNIITDKHINIFADSILAGCSLENGLYPVKDMKFVKDNRQLRDFSEFEGEVSREWFDACRYAESSLSRNYLCRYFKQRNPDFKTVSSKKALLKANDSSCAGTINLHNYKIQNSAAGVNEDEITTYGQFLSVMNTGLGGILLSSFAQIANPSHSVNSICESMISVLNILKGQRSN